MAISKLRLVLLSVIVLLLGVLLYPAAGISATTYYTITATAGDHGSINPSGSVSVERGNDKAFTIKPDTDYQVSSLLVDGSPTSISETGGTYTFNNVKKDHTIAVTFNHKPMTITASAGANGSISPSGNVSVNYGSNQTFSFTPNTGYHVAMVLVDGSAVTITGNQYIFSGVTANHTISVTFTINTYTITATAGTGGSISPSGAVSVNHFGSQSFTMTANTGYILDKVTVDGTEITMAGNTYTFNNINQDHTITATFKATGGGTGGTSAIPGCGANTYTSYSGGFNAGDFSMINTSVVNSKIQLQTGNQAINPEQIVIPFTQTVAATFIYENAGFSQNDFGWILATDGPSGTKHEVYRDINDNNNNGVLDDREGVDSNGDGTVNVLDNRVVLGTFAGGTELVFYLKVDEQSYTAFTKTEWNTDTFQGNCTLSSFDKTFKLGDTTNTFNACGPSSWLDSAAVTRLANPPLNLDFGSTQKTVHIVRNQKFPHVQVAAPNTKPNEWILAWEDYKNGGDYDINDMVFRVDRRTGGSASLQSSQAITPIDTEAYFTGVTFEVYDNMPCDGQSSIKYYVSINNGANWVEITSWDLVKSFTVSGSTKSVGNDVSNWTPGTPALTYRVRRLDFSGSAMVGRQLLWKAEMFSDSESCVPEIVDVVLNGSVATHGFVSRASPSVQANMLYSGSYETPALSWTEKVLRGHLYGTRLYDPDTPNTQNPVQQWDAGAKLTAMSPANRNVYFPNISYSSVTSETLGTGDGTTTHFSGTLAHHPVSATTLIISDSLETFIDKHTDVLEGDFGGSGTINRFTGEYSLDFHTAPSNGMPIRASYTYYTTSTTLREFTTSNVSNAMLALDNTYIIPTGYKYDFNGDNQYTEADGDFLVNWIRGYKDGSSTKKEWLLGQIDHSVPAVETPPGRPGWYFGSAVTKAERDAFDTFLKTNWNRQTVVYVGSRDGMLHAFDAGQFRWGYLDSDNNFQWMKKQGDTALYYRGYFDNKDYGTGDELWAFIPANLLPRLKNNKIAGEDQAYVDASPAISDVEINGTWKTVLLSAEGNGGDTVFCLDITNPTVPTFMWEFADPDLFRSRSSPAVAVIGKTVVNGTKKWAAFFVSGKTYDNTLYPSIYMIDIGTGAVLKRIYLDSPSDGVGGVPSGQPAVVDSDGNGYVDRIYIGTDKGYLYKVIIPDDPNTSSGYDIAHCVINTDYTDDHGYTIPSDQRNHPIYASPAVVVANGYNSKGEIQYNIKILYGTGDSPYYDEDIDTANTKYHFFAYRDSAAKGQCTASDATLDWAYELPAGARVFASAFAAAGQVYFGTATSETEDPCEGAGSTSANQGKLYVMSLEPGSGTVAPITTVNTGNVLAAPVVDDEHLYVKGVGSGLKTTPGPYNNPVTLYGVPASAVKYWREVFDKDEKIVN
ncbi:InlB B-repeat-containing protein [Desulfatirhabdium butyrativorans]|uniref:InlB B-repeat-containing protein n=1 Tax=Desulfatirhabdium butyrativorans TaxID=340467 RepID=UPI0004825960|nr:PilC/PilY family type IV pilus protein [Desulfatirhabdium butyrativorans]